MRQPGSDFSCRTWTTVVRVASPMTEWQLGIVRWRPLWSASSGIVRFELPRTAQRFPEGICDVDRLYTESSSSKVILPITLKTTVKMTKDFYLQHLPLFFYYCFDVWSSCGKVYCQLFGYSIDSRAFSFNSDCRIVGRRLPQPKRTDYNLRQRTRNLTLPTDGNLVMKQNFVYRMVFKDIYWLIFLPTFNVIFLLNTFTQRHSYLCVYAFVSCAFVICY